MKNKILTFTIGMLVGAIITTVGFTIYIKTNNSNNNINNNRMEMRGPRGDMMNGERPEMPDDMQNSQNNGISGKAQRKTKTNNQGSQTNEATNQNEPTAIPNQQNETTNS